MRLAIPEKNEHDLYFRMSDLAAFSKLLYAMKEINHVLRINFTPDGLYLSEFAANRNVLLFCSFKASDFIKYECSGPGFIAVNCGHFYKVLQNHHQKDELALTYKCPSANQKKREELRFEIIKESCVRKKEEEDDEDGTNWHQKSEYTIPIYVADKEMYESKVENVDLAAIISMNTFHHFVSSIKDIEIDGGDSSGQVNLFVSNEEVTLEKRAGSLLSQCRLTLLTSKGKQKKRDLSKRSIAPDSIRKTFWMRHLVETLKFFDISSQDATVVVYIKVDPPNFPVIFEVSVGAIGQLRIAFSPAEE